VHGAVEFTLDKNQNYTQIIFFLQRILLTVSLLIALIDLVDAQRTANAGNCCVWLLNCICDQLTKYHWRGYGLSVITSIAR
jgi:hypothetical protein